MPTPLEKNLILLNICVNNRPSMSYCLNPNCQKPQNPTESNFCLNCGSKLILRERYRALKVIGQGGFGKTFLSLTPIAGCLSQR
jgi:hypothetical protein